MLLPLIFVILTGLVLYYLFLSHGSKPKWWGKYGIPEIDVISRISNLDILLGKRSVIDRDDIAYQLMGTQKFCGIMESPSPIILVKDLELIKKITIKDFDFFVDRRDFFPVPKKSILAKLLGMLKGDEWKSVRSTVSPVFTTGKIRRMMPHFNSVGQKWIRMLKEKNVSGEIKIDVLDTVNQYTVEVIASAVFGLNFGTVEDENSVFLQMANRLTNLTTIEYLRQNLSPRYPKLFRLLGIDPMDSTAINFFEGILRQGLKARSESSDQVPRNDFLQLLIEARKGEVKAFGEDELSNFEKEAALGQTSKKQYLTDQILVAQAVVFFLAGFQTTTTFISAVLHILAIHQDVQEKLRKEVNQVVNEDGTIDYDSLGQLGYLEMVTSEVMRLYPVAQRLERMATKNYRDLESGLVVPEGTVVAFPTKSIHRDPAYYSNPDKFDPENFNVENKAKRHPYAYFPFGIGPRNCIGMRFALVESKSAIAHVVYNFLVEPTEKTPIPMRLTNVSLTTAPVPGLELKLTPITH